MLKAIIGCRLRVCFQRDYFLLFPDCIQIVCRSIVYSDFRSNRILLSGSIFPVCKIVSSRHFKSSLLKRNRSVIILSVNCGGFISQVRACRIIRMICDRCFLSGISIDRSKCKIRCNLYFISRIVSIIAAILPVKECLSLWSSNSSCRHNVCIGILCILFAVYRSCPGSFT